MGATTFGGCPPYGWPAPPAELVGGDLEARGASMDIAVLGIDLGKNSCSVVGLDGSGKVILRRRMQRKTIVGLASKLSPCIIAMEACCGAHHLGRVFSAQAHTVRLMSPEYVRPYVKAQKNDDRDAEAIAEAATRPTMVGGGFRPAVSGDEFFRPPCRPILTRTMSACLFGRGPWAGPSAIGSACTGRTAAPTACTMPRRWASRRSAPSTTSASSASTCASAASRRLRPTFFCSTVVVRQPSHARLRSFARRTQLNPSLRVGEELNKQLAAFRDGTARTSSFSSIWLHPPRPCAGATPADVGRDR